MLSNSQCDPECNVAACNYDSLSCGCAANCNYSDLGSCKSACLVPDCDYDAYPGYPSCQSPELQIEALYYQLLASNFSGVFAYVFDPKLNCTYKNCLRSLSGCIAACGLTAFMKSLGSYSVNQTSCNVVVNNAVCLDCVSGMYNQYGTCVSGCWPGLAPHPLWPGLCYPLPETINEEVLIYVNVTSTGVQDGTILHPFSTLAAAFASVTHRYTKVLLFPGTHILDRGAQSIFVQPNSTSITNQAGVAPPNLSRLVLTAKDCPYGLCVRPLIRYDSKSLRHLYFPASTEIANVDFDGNTSIAANCTDIRCFAISAVSYSNFTYFDDRGQVVDVSVFPGSSFPSFVPFEWNSFINAANISMENVTFTNFRQYMRNLIQATNGQLRLSNVHFRNVTCFSAVLSQSGGNFTYENGGVELVNNGAEFLSGMVNGVVLQISNVQNVTIRSVRFAYNFNSPTVMSAALYGFLMNGQVSIENCTFEFNIRQTYPVMLFDLTLPVAISTSDQIYLLTEYRVSITNCLFLNNSAVNSALISITNADSASILLSNCSFRNNLSMNSGLIVISGVNQTAPHSVFPYSRNVFLSGTQTRVRVAIPARVTLLSFLTFSNCHASAGFIRVSNLPNVRLSNVVIANNTLSSVNYYRNTLSAFTLRPDVYMRVSLDYVPPQPCADGISLANCTNTQIVGLWEDHIYCASGTAGGTFFNLTGNNSVVESRFSGVLGNGLPGGVLALNYSKVSLVNVAVLNCSNLAPVGVIGGIGKASIEILNSTFSYCKSMYGAVLTSISMLSIDISSSVFSSNEASSSGGVLAIQYGFVQLTISNSEFTSNAATNGGVLFYDKSALVVSFNISNSKFNRNWAQFGSGIYIPKIDIPAGAVIEACVFEGNVGAIEGLLFLEYTSGVFRIYSSEFVRNLGLNTALIFGGFTSSLELVNLFISENTGTWLISFPDQTLNPFCSAKNIVFQNNTGTAFNLIHSSLICSNSSFTANQSPSASAFSLFSGSNSTFITSNFTHNKSFFQGGVGFISEKSGITVTSCLFENNTSEASAAVFYLDSESKAEISASGFLYNYGVLKGFFADLSLNSAILFTDSLILGNSGLEDGLISLFSSNVTFVRTKVANNKSAGNSAGILICLSSVLAVNSTFSGQTAKTATFFSLSAHSVGEFRGCLFSSGAAVGYGGAVFILESQISISNCVFSDLSASSGSAISARINSQISISNSSFTAQRTEVDGGVISASGSRLTISDSQFSGYSEGGVVLTQSLLRVSGSSFGCISYVDGSGHLGGGITCIGCLDVFIMDSRFIGLSAVTGGAVYLIDSDFGLVSNSVFRRNTAIDSGAVFVDNLSLNFTGNSFIENNATGSSDDISNRGGAVTVLCSKTRNSCQYFFASNLFQRNSADEKGGAVCWEQAPPFFFNNEFRDNEAKYGNDIASFPITLTASNDTLLDNIGSGQISSKLLILELRDHYGNIVTIDNSDLAEIVSVRNSSEISGQSQAKAINGTFTFEGYIISAAPLTTVKVNVTTLTLQTQSFLVFNVSMRDCIIGESLTNGQCQICPAGKYSLDPKLDCQKCPEGAECLGNFTMVPKPGYWRSSNLSDVFFPCPNADACLGSQGSYSPTGLCSPGYEGNKCQQCSPGSTQFSRLYCLPCPALSTSILRLVGFTLLFFVLVALMVKYTLRSVVYSKSHLAVHLKVLINYAQLTMLMSALGLNWTGPTLTLYEIQDAIGSMVDQILMVDCFLSQSSATAVYLSKLVAMGLLPLAVSVLAALLWLIVAVRRKSAAVMRNQCVATVVVACFVMHTSVVRMMLGIFNCEEIDPGMYWVVGLDLRCWEGTHLKYAFGLALPSLIIWGFALPACCLLVLKINTFRQISQITKTRLGFLYTKYQPSAYYWEFLIISRKALIIAVTVFLSNVSVFLQSVSVLNVLLLTLIFQYKAKPFTQSNLNELEQRSVLVAILTIYCGFFYYSLELSESLKAFVFFLILFANVYFLAYWLYLALNDTLRLALRKVKFLRKVFKAVGNEGNYQKSVVKSQRNFRSTTQFQLCLTELERTLSEEYQSVIPL